MRITENSESDLESQTNVVPTSLVSAFEMFVSEDLSGVCPGQFNQEDFISKEQYSANEEHAISQRPLQQADDGAFEHTSNGDSSKKMRITENLESDLIDLEAQTNVVPTSSMSASGMFASEDLLGVCPGQVNQEAFIPKEQYSADKEHVISQRPLQQADDRPFTAYQVET
ncbi:hypothetical protein MRB53_023689 [Persea americana]|uniref:Uncharacterized protein n=1 Tax=Persea americana TaxID=3435 RepID=A0ACC2LAX6_PERAE|nr:hypothetical protein MRB53_023689 [Persea americana]